VSGLDVLRIVLAAVVALLLITTGGGKLAGASSSHAIRDSLKIGAAPWRMIGVFELVLVALLIVGIWLPVSALIGFAGAIVLMVGAVAARVRAGGAQRRTGVPADVVIGLVAVAGVVVAAVTL
jgi:hypothetical protein